jgi:hypothetical protein
MAVKELSDGGTDGVRLGQDTSDKVGFFGETPVVRYATSIAAPTSTAAVSISATQWGFTSSAAADSLITTVFKLQTAMQAYGLVSSS